MVGYDRHLFKIQIHRKMKISNKHLLIRHRGKKLIIYDVFLYVTNIYRARLLRKTKQTEA